MTATLAECLKLADGLPDLPEMSFLSRWRDRNSVSLEDNSLELGLKYKDVLVLEQMVGAGADLQLPRHVLYYLYFPSREQAEAAAAEVARSDFSSEVREPLPEYPDQWALVCERHDYVLDAAAVRDNTDFFERLADDHVGQFDGWEASLD